MDTTHSNRAPLPSKGIQYLFVALYFAVAAWLCWFENPTQLAVSMDNKIYYFVSERVASGEAPHVSLVDHKHALSSMLSGWAMAIGRSVGAPDLISARILSITVAAGTVAAVWALTLRMSGRLLSAHMSGLVMLTFSTFLVQGTMGMRPKVFMAFFMVLGLLAYADRKPGRSGAYGCAAFLCWQPALLVLGASGAAALFVERRAAAVLRMIGGAVAVFLLYEAYFAWHGALGEQLYQSFVMASDTGFKRYPTVASAIRFVLRPGPWSHKAEFVFPLILLGFLAGLPLLLAVHPRRVLAQFALRPDRCAVLAAAYLVVAFTLVEHQAYPDRFFLHPFVAIACGLFAAWFIDRIAAGKRPLVRNTVAIACMLAVSVPALPREERPIYTLRHRQARERLADVVERLVGRYESVWCIGCLDLLAMRRLPNHSPFGLLVDPRVRAYAKTKAVGSPYQPLEADELPAMILGQRYPEHATFPWLRDRYRRLRPPVFANTEIRVWLRKDARRPPQWLKVPPKPLPGQRQRQPWQKYPRSGPAGKADLITELLIAAGYTDCDLKACDFDGDGQLTMSDVDLLILCKRLTDAAARSACKRVQMRQSAGKNK
jgi:hypothetical protein